jgi:hypothetical protein
MQRFAHGFIVGQNRIFGKRQKAFSFSRRPTILHAACALYDVRL